MRRHILGAPLSPVLTTARMTHTSRRFDVMVGVLAACASACTVPDGGSADALTGRIDALVAPLVAANEFSGAIVMMRGGAAVHARGFGIANHAAGIAFTPETPADGGSVAKTFTAAGIWWLADEGLVALDTAVRRYVPEYPHEQTTVRQLLSHSNGLPPDYGFFDAHFGTDDVRATTEMLRIVAKELPQPSFTPGTRFEYSNLGYDAAALVIERVTGRSYATFVQERFFSRLDLRSSFARPARLAEWDGVRTIGYRWRDGAWDLHDSFDGEAFLGASNLYFSAADLARWGSANARGVALPADVFEAGQTQLRVSGLPLELTGLSWYCDQRKVRCTYGGHNAGFHVFVYWDRELDGSVAFVSNSTLPAWKIVGLQRDLVHAWEGRPAVADTGAAFLDVLDVDPSEIAGRYVATGAPVLTVTAVQGRGIMMRLDSGVEYDAYPAARDVLYVPGLDLYLAFSGDTADRALYAKSLELDFVLRRSTADTGGIR